MQPNDERHRTMTSPDVVVGQINRGNPEECTVGALAKTTVALTGSRSTRVRCPLPHDERSVRS